MCLQFTAGFMLLASLLWLLDTSGVVSACVPAVLVHELGHAAALRLCGARITAICFEACGLRMDYAGCLSRTEELLCTLAGPACGLLYACAAALFGRCTGSEFLFCTAGVSLSLSAFNLLPAPMLDGGRILSALNCGRLRALGLITGAVLMLGGALLLRSVYGLLLLAAGAWVTIGSCKYPVGGIE